MISIIATDELLSADPALPVQLIFVAVRVATALGMVSTDSSGYDR